MSLLVVKCDISATVLRHLVNDRSLENSLNTLATIYESNLVNSTLELHTLRTEDILETYPDIVNDSFDYKRLQST